ncbi:Uncharacterised protein [Bacillus freudenreichii]|nr:Uncharacterised protein [Bacillus freudenreichii]
MDKRWFGAFLILLFLVGCGAKQANVEEPEAGAEEIEEKEEAVQLSVEEAQEIVERNMEEISKQLKDLQGEKTDWFHQEWIFEPESDKEKYEQAKALVKERLKDLVTESGMELQVPIWMTANWCECDSVPDTLFWDHGISHQLIEQKEDRFIISYLITNIDDGLSRGKRTVEYIKENEEWKLNDVKRISPEEERLELTFEDVEAFLAAQYGGGENVELIEETGDYFVVKQGDFYWAIHKNDGTFNYNLIEKYKEAPEETVVESPIEEDTEEEEGFEEEKEPETVQAEVSSSEIGKFTGLWEEPGRSEETPYMMVDIQNVEGGQATVRVAYMSVGARQIADVEGQVVFENGVGSFTYDEDGWNGSGEVTVDLTGEGPIIKVKINNDGMGWGLFDGSYKVTKRAE